MLFLFSGCGTADNIDISYEHFIKTATLEKLSDLDSLENIDIAKVEAGALLQAEPDVIMEKLDEGVMLVAERMSENDIIRVAENLHVDFEPIEKTGTQTTYGMILRKADGNYRITEVVAQLAKKERFGKVIEPSEGAVKNSLDWIRENGEIDLGTAYFDTIMQDEKAIEMESAFAVKNVQYTLYTSSTEVNNTTFNPNLGTSYVLARVKILFIGLKTLTDGTTTYDTFAADFNVSGISGQSEVREFHAKLGTPSSTRYALFPEYISSDSTQTYTFGANYSEEGISGGLSYSYTGKTGGLDVVNYFGDNLYSNWWKATPITPQRGAAYVFSTGMMLKTTSGTTTTATARATFSYIKVNNGLLSNWVCDEDLVVPINFKNHQQV